MCGRIFGKFWGTWRGSLIWEDTYTILPTIILRILCIAQSYVTLQPEVHVSISLSTYDYNSHLFGDAADINAGSTHSTRLDYCHLGVSSRERQYHDMCGGVRHKGSLDLCSPSPKVLTGTLASYVAALLALATPPLPPPITK